MSANLKTKYSDRLLLDHLVDSLSVGTWEWNVQTGETIFNERWAAIIGYSLEELQPVSINTWASFAHPDDLKKSNAALEEYFSGRTDMYRIESRMKHRDGSWIWVQDSGFCVSRTADGKPEWMVGTHLPISDIVKIRNKGQQSALNYQTIFNETSEGIILINPDHTVHEVNAAFAEMHGYSIDEILNIDLRDLSSTDASNNLEERISLVQAGETLDFQTVHLKKNGEKLHLKVLAVPIMQDGTVRLLGFHRDITLFVKEKVMLEKRIELAEYSIDHTLHEILVKTLDDICEISGSSVGFYHFVSPDQQSLSLQAWSTRTTREFCTALGAGFHYPIADAGVWVDCVRERKPVIHNDYKNLPHKKGMPEGHAEVIRELVIPIIRGERIVSILGVGNKATDYTQSDVDVVSLFADMAWEISERKMAELAREESERRFRDFFRNDLTGDLISTVDGKIISCNPSFLRIFGYKHQDEINMLYLYSDPDDRQMILDRIHRNKTFEYLELTMKHRDGSDINVVMSAHGIFNAEGELTHIMSYVFDDTERHKLAEQLETSRKLEGIGKLAGGIAHDFNNILTSILGFTDLAKLRKGDNEQVEIALNQIQTASQRATDLVHQLLAFSRKQVYRPAEIDINSTLLNLEPMIMRLIGDEIRLQMNLGSSLPGIYADPSQIEQIMVNLIMNARDSYMEMNGAPADRTIMISTRIPEVTGTGAPENTVHYLEIIVTDHATGIPPEILSRIFDPFFTTKSVGRGKGLGLSTVYGIVKQNRGNVLVDSRPGRGSTFRIFWPLD